MTGQIPIEELAEAVAMVRSKRLGKWGAIHYSFLAESILGVVTNFLLCLVFARQRQLRTARNVYVVNLAVGNLLMAASLVPLVFDPMTEAYWTKGDFACKFYNAFAGMNVYCCMFSTMAISADRCITVTRQSLENNSRKDFRKSALACCVIWLCSLLCVLPLYIFYRTSDSLINFTLLMTSGHDHPPGNDSTTVANNSEAQLLLGKICKLETTATILLVTDIAQLLVLFVIPLAFICACSYKLHVVLKNRERGIGHNSCRHVSVNVSPTGYKKRNGDRRSSRAPGMVLTMRKKHRRIDTVHFLMVISITVLWLPFHIMTIIRDFYNTKEDHQLAGIVSQLLGHFSLTTTPFLYGFLNNNFKRGILKMVCGWSSKAGELTNVLKEGVSNKRSCIPSKEKAQYAPPSSVVLAL